MVAQCRLDVCSVEEKLRALAWEKRQRGDLNPCGQSPMDFESISLTARTHCLGLKWTTNVEPWRVPAWQASSSGVVAQCRVDVCSVEEKLGALAWEKATARGFEPLRAEPNGFQVHLLSRSDTVSLV